MKEKEEYIGGPTGGVPEKIFTSPKEPQYGIIDSVGTTGKYLTYGKSGNPLRYTVTKHAVLVTASDLNGNYMFKASRVKEDMYSNFDTLTLHIKTKRGADNQKHPDLYASELVKRSIAYFEEQGPEIRKLKGFWLAGDNYDAYHDYVNRIKQERPLREKDKEDAARHTWTGKLADSLGFTQIENVSTGILVSRSIKVIFSKPSSY